MYRILIILFLLLGVTAPHPIFSTTHNDWRLAGELEVGEKVLSYHGEASVLSNVKKEGSEIVYNLEVKDLHNFLVGNVGVVVHNNYIQNLLKGIKGAKGLLGNAYEEFLIALFPNAKKVLPKALGSWQQREYDIFFELNGKKILGEAKSGNALNANAWPNVRSTLGQQNADAIANGYEFYLFSNTPIPSYVKIWCNSKGIPFVETLD
ncbi:MAG TPA: Hint domain-containing protein [Saprospiraceae bacterium]|nr:Hint domain-containing protein [Saprospiraceae bacterium]